MAVAFMREKEWGRKGMAGIRWGQGSGKGWRIVRIFEPSNGPWGAFWPI